MSDVMIRVENLGKKYMIGHQAEGRSNYVALRDVLADGAKSLVKRFTGRGQGQRATQEEFWALKDVSFEVKRGECVGIIGRNGAGKSTLLKILSRITEPTTGRIELNGRVASLLEVGTGFHPELTGRENIYLNGAILGMSRREIKAKFDEIVDFAEVERFLDTPVKRYSSGMYVRLAFAVAAHLEPEILVVDEVLAVGDAAFQKKCLGKMGDVATKEGRTVLFVSHNMRAMRALCQQGIYLLQGEVIAKKNIQESISDYINEQLKSNDFEWYLQNRDPDTNSDIILSVSIKKEDFGKPVPIDQDIIIVINFKKNTIGQDLYVSIHLMDKLNNCVFASVSFPRNTSGYTSISKMQPGLYEARVTIPRHLLNDQEYSIGALLVDQSTMGIVDWRRNVIFFKVDDTEESRDGFLGEWIGCIRPQLKWNICLTQK